MNEIIRMIREGIFVSFQLLDEIQFNKNMGNLGFSLLDYIIAVLVISFTIPILIQVGGKGFGDSVGYYKNEKRREQRRLEKSYKNKSGHSNN